jgi:flagellar protein FliS
MAIVGELQSTLNIEEGSNLALELDRLYDYMFGRLLEVTTKKDMSALEEVRQLLVTVREGWVQVSASVAASPPRS